MSKWRHSDGGSQQDTEALHLLLARIEGRIGELGTGGWGAEFLNGVLRVSNDSGYIEMDLPSKFGQRTRDWIIDAVIARKSMRKQRNDPTFGAST